MTQSDDLQALTEIIRNHEDSSLQTEIDRLKSIIQNHDGPGYTTELDKLKAENARLRARMAELEKDGSSYENLR